jgi:hypothetical protein
VVADKAVGDASRHRGPGRREAGVNHEFTGDYLALHASKTSIAPGLGQGLFSHRERIQDLARGCYGGLCPSPYGSERFMNQLDWVVSPATEG